MPRYIMKLQAKRYVPEVIKHIHYFHANYTILLMLALYSDHAVTISLQAPASLN
jgi:hypothetical protein